MSKLLLIALALFSATAVLGDQTWVVTQSGFAYFVNGVGPNPTMYVHNGEDIHVTSDATTNGHNICSSTTHGSPSAGEPSIPGYSNGPTHGSCPQGAAVDFHITVIASPTTWYLECQPHGDALLVTVHLVEESSSTGSAAGQATASSTAVAAAAASSTAGVAVVSSTGPAGPVTPPELFWTITSPAGYRVNGGSDNPTMNVLANQKISLTVTTGSTHPVCVSTSDTNVHAVYSGWTSVHTCSNNAMMNVTTLNLATAHTFYLICEIHGSAFLVTVNVAAGNPTTTSTGGNSNTGGANGGSTGVTGTGAASSGAVPSVFTAIVCIAVAAVINRKQLL